MKDTRSHGALWRAHDRGDLGARSLLDLSEDHGHTLLEGKLVEREHEAIGELAALDVALRIGGCGLGLTPESGEGRAPPGRRPHMVLRLIDRDRDEKGPERAVTPETSDRRGQRDEDVLNEILGGLDVTDEALGERPHRDMMLAIHERHRAHVGALEPYDERMWGVIPPVGVGRVSDELRHRSGVHGARAFVTGARRFVQSKMRNTSCGQN